MSRVRILLVLVIVIFSLKTSNATHIVGGEITYKLINPTSNTYEITITGYVDIASAQVTFGGGNLDFGDGSEPIIDIRNDSRISIIKDEEIIENGRDLAVTQFRVIYSYVAKGSYTISYVEANRNNGILNMSNSVETAFYIESLIVADNDKFENNSATFLIPLNQFFCESSEVHIPLGVYDVDGDSLSFILRTPKMSRSKDVDGYKFPNDISFYNNPNLSGSIEFDRFGNINMYSPSSNGGYVLSVWITEWRILNGELKVVGKTLRDFMITVIGDCPNSSIELNIPDSIFFKPEVSTTQEFVIINPEGVDAANIYHDLLKTGSNLTYDFTENSLILSSQLGCPQLSHPIGFVTTQLLVDSYAPIISKSSTVIIDPVGTNCSFLEVEGNTEYVEGENLKVKIKNIGLKNLNISDINTPDGITVSFTQALVVGESERELEIMFDNFYSGYSSLIEIISDADGGDSYILILGEEAPLGFAEQKNKRATIYPNPGGNHVFINSDILFNSAVIYDFEGKLLFIQKLKNKTLNLEQLPIGVYLVEFVSLNHRETHRIVKRHNGQK